MAEYLTEQEQVELLKKWLKQYSLVIVIGVISAFVMIYGWRYWQEVKEKKVAEASLLYDEMLTLSTQNNASEANARAIKLYDKYAKTPYGEMAALYLARGAVAKQNFIEAKQYLNWITEEARQSAIRQIARLRMARILIAENKPEKALTTLDKIDDNAFLALILEVRGDAWLKTKDISKAQEAYREAIKALPNAEVIRPILGIKFDNLVGAE